MKILIADDDPQFLKALRITLRSQGYEIVTASDGVQCISAAVEHHPDLMVLDLGMPKMDGMGVIQGVRGWTDAPILVVSGRTDAREKVAALDAGADDYITKPFSMGELLARMRVSVRRSAHVGEDPVIQCGDLSIDLAQRRVMVDAQEIKLTPTEYDIIKILAQNAGKVLTHRQLLKAVWGDTYSDDTHYIRVYIGQLRRKIEPNPTQPRYIVTESGVGYRLMTR